MVERWAGSSEWQRDWFDCANAGAACMEMISDGTLAPRRCEIPFRSARHSGEMFWFKWKKLSGSYFTFRALSRSYFCSP